MFGLGSGGEFGQSIPLFRRNDCFELASVWSRYGNRVLLEIRWQSWLGSRCQPVCSSSIVAVGAVDSGPSSCVVIECPSLCSFGTGLYGIGLSSGALFPSGLGQSKVNPCCRCLEWASELSPSVQAAVEMLSAVPGLTRQPLCRAGYCLSIAK